MPDRSHRIAGLLLAAGASSRLGHPKQLMEIDGIPLVRRAALNALATACDRVFVVVGANRAPVVAAMAGLDVEIVENRGWPEGIGSSLRVGIRWVEACEPGYDAVLIMLVDQYKVGVEHLDRLIAAFRQSGIIAASEYDGAPGVPALFPSLYFRALRELAGDTGAKSLLGKPCSQVVRIPCPDASFDLDTVSEIPVRVRESI